MKCSARRHPPGIIQMNLSRKANGRWIVCVRHNSGCSKRMEVLMANPLNQANRLDARNRSVIFVNVRHRLQHVSAKSRKTWRTSHVAVDRMARTQIRKERESSWPNEKTHWLTP